MIYLNEIAVGDKKVPVPEEEQGVHEYDYIGFANTNVNRNATESSTSDGVAKDASEIALTSCPAYGTVLEQQ